MTSPAPSRATPIFATPKRKVVQRRSENATPYRAEVRSDFVPAPGTAEEFTPGKTHYRTRDGKPARILSGDIKGSDQPSIAAIDFGSREEVRSYRPDGRTVWGGIHDHDLIDVGGAK